MLEMSKFQKYLGSELMEFGEVKDEKLDSYGASEDMKWYSLCSTIQQC